MRQHKSGLIIPRGTEGLTARLRRPPSPQVEAGVGGWIEWGLIDRGDRVVAGGEQHNLFLNQGLDAIATAGGSSITNIAWFAQMSVGTGSVEPDVTDTALSSELALSSTKISSPGYTRVADGVYQTTQVFEFDFSVANGNLTEWGLRAFGSNPLVTRELFRDGQGNPIVITKTSDYKLRIAYTFEIALSPTVLTPASFTIDGIGLISGNYMYRGGPPSGNYSQRDLNAFAGIAAGSQSTSQGLYNASSGVDPGSYAEALGVGMQRTGLNQAERPTSQTPSLYTDGDYSRSAVGMWGTGQANNLIATLAVQGDSSTVTIVRTGFVFIIDEADRFVKDSEHTLTINDLLTVTWGREGELQ